MTCRQGRHVSKQVKRLLPRNPAQGIRTFGVRLTWLAWGASSLATGGTGDTKPGTVGKSDGRE